VIKDDGWFRVHEDGLEFTRMVLCGLRVLYPDKHQLKFNIHKDAKSLMEAIEKRFGGNKETKKVEKTLLKQQYENFSGQSSESLDQIHDRLQKLISQLEILSESISQEDINLKFLRSLPSENFMPPKPDLVFHDALPASETVPNVVHVVSSTNKTSKEMFKTLKADAPIIEDWTSDSKDESEPESVSNQKEPSFV
nr:hypothetical protein [Tanacetum cinerariifolium]